jgi:hypothetical protein
MYKAFALRILHNPRPDEVRALLIRGRDRGANAVTLVIHHYCSIKPGTAIFGTPPAYFGQVGTAERIFPDIAQDLTHPFGNTPSPDLVLNIARQAESLGLTVFLKPHLDSYDASWRGNISVQGVASQFRTAYRAFIRRYTQIAKQLRNPVFVLGTELYTVTKELGAAFWIEQAAWVRSRYGAAYNGPLTYAANWGVGPDAEYNRLAALWPVLDFIGVDAYFPLVRPDSAPSPSFDTLLAGWDAPLGSAGWEPTPAADVLAIAQSSGRPVMFTEFGVGNYTEAAKTPWADAPQNAVRDDILQADYYRAMRARFAPEPLFAGFAAWEMFLGPNGDVSHNIVDRPAEAVAFL